jgi:hypothetical protein
MKRSSPPVPPLAPLARSGLLPLRVLAPLLLGLVVGLAGCGHPATREECDLILDKIVELELRGQNVTDPAVIAQRKDDTRKAKGEELMQKCLGRKVTDARMACVKNAISYDQIENQCLR